MPSFESSRVFVGCAKETLAPRQDLQQHSDVLSVTSDHVKHITELLLCSNETQTHSAAQNLAKGVESDHPVVRCRMISLLSYVVIRVVVSKSGHTERFFQPLH